MPRVRQIVGLDLGTRNVRAVWVELHNGSPRVLRAEKMELPLEGGDALKLTRAWLEQLGLLHGFASVAVPGPQLVFQPGRLTPDDPRTPRQAADMELVRFNDMVGETMVCDVTAYNGADASRQYLMAMARPSIIRDALSALEPISIRPTDLVPAPAALFCGFACAESDTDGPRLIVDIGAVKTEIAIGTNEGILFARAFPLGGRHFTEALAKGGACPLQQADSQKLRDATLDEGGPYSEFLLPVAERWYSQFSAVMAAYRSAVPGQKMGISAVILTGGGAKLAGFPNWLEARLSRKTGAKSPAKGEEDLWSPYALNKSIASGDSKESIPLKVNPLPSVRVIPAAELPCPSGIPDLCTYATAIGLALTSLDAPNLPHLSLIPESLRDEVVFKEKKPYWIATAATLILAIGVFTAGLLISLGRDSVRLEAERQELRKREKIDNEIAAIRAETEAIRKEAVPLRRLLVGGPASRYAMSLVATAIAPADWISLVCDEETYLRHEAPKPVPEALKPVRPGFFVPGFRDNDPKARESSSVFTDAEAKPAPEKSKFTSFIIEGYTPDMSFKSVDEMLRRIRGGARVKSVDLLSDDKVKPPAELPEAIKALNLPEMRRFVIRMEVAQP